MSELRFTSDWFSAHVPEWERHVVPRLRGHAVHFLEIGCYEGRSACWLLQKVLTHPQSQLTCIDLFVAPRGRGCEGTDAVATATADVPPPVDYEANFDHNIASLGAGERVIKLKGRSEEILRTLPLSTFDGIYVDGSHRASDVLRDIVLSWDLVKPGGLMILDDYLWREAPGQPLNTPRPGIDAFLAVFRGKFETLSKNYQVILQKISKDR